MLRSWVRIPRGAWMFVCCECCVLSGRCFCKGLITRPEESYRLWYIVVCDQETSKTRRLKACYWALKNTPAMGCNARRKNGLTGDEVTRMTKKSYKLHNLISFAKWQGNISKDDKAGHLVFHDKCGIRGLFKKYPDWNCSGCSLGGMCLQPVLTCSYMS